MVGSLSVTSLSYGNSVSGESTGPITVGFTFSGNLASGDHVTLALPGFFGTTNTVSTGFGGASGASFASAAWSSVQQTVVLTLAASVTGGNSITLIIPSTLAISLPTVGLPANSGSLTLSVTAVSSAAAAVGIITSPAINAGAFTASNLTYGNSIVGQSTGVCTLSFTFSADLVSGSTITLTLPGFTGSSNTVSTGFTGANAASFTQAAWTLGPNTLVLTVSATSITGNTASVLVIPSTLGLVFPTPGLALNSVGLTIGATDSDGNAAAASITSSPTVNTAVFSSTTLSYANSTTGESTGAMTLGFTYSADLVSGSTVTVTLTGFTGTGITQTSFTGANGASVSSAAWTSSTTTLVLTMGATTTGNTAFTVVIPSGLGLTFPTAGLSLNSASLKISATATAGSAAAVAIVASPAISNGAFIATSLSYGNSITGQATGAITLSFIYSADLVSGSTVTVTLSGFTGSGMTQTSFTGVNAANVGSAAWTSGDTTLVLTTTGAAVTGNTAFSVVVPSALGLSFPASGLTANSVQLTISATATAGNAVSVPIATSPAINQGW